MAYNTSYQSPNFDEREREIDMIVIHYTEMNSAKAALERLCDPETKVSAHYLIDEDGTIYQMVDESKRAWHAGVSVWNGVENLNHNSIGIELDNTGDKPFTQAQYDSLIPLCQEIKSRYNIPDINIVGHEDIAPGRKQDPGELFDWKLLADNGLGLWPHPKA